MVHNCTIEYLPNIRQLYILIPINIDNTNINTKLFLNRDKKTLHMLSENDQSTLLISVPGLVFVEELKVPIEGDLESLPRVHRIDNVLIIQFRNAVTCTGTHSSLVQLPCAKELQGHCKNISCTNCGSSLIKLDNNFMIFKDLPNEHWLELLDCWSCHDNEFAPIAERALNSTESKTRNTCHDHQHDDHDCNKKSSSYHDMTNSNSGLILPPMGKIYLGNGYFLMNQADFNHEKCPNCKTELGEFIKKTGHVKIYRDLIKFDSFAQESFLEILMHRILDTIDNHSTFHFILKCGDERIYLRPIHWNLQIFDLESGKWKIAFKLGYSKVSSSVNLEAEVINCTSEQFNQISEHLNHCHENLLFNSFLKLPGSEVLRISYLIKD